MEIKGTAIKSTREFVMAKFPEKYELWINSLPEKTREIYSSSMINMAGWYPMKEDYQAPMERIIELFYEGDIKKGAEDMGRFSADLALTGIYKLFLIIATPKYLMTRASVVFSTFYLPCEVIITDSSSKSVTMQITKFPDLSSAIEYRIAGWCVRSLELCGCKKVRYITTKSLLHNNNETEFLYTWE